MNVEVKHRTRRHKAEVDLRTRYYYRQGVLQLVPVSNSPLGVVAGAYVYIRKYSKECRKFLVINAEGRMCWTGAVIHVRPEVDGHELYYTTFSQLMERRCKEGTLVWYRTLAGFAYLKKDQHCEPAPDYAVFTAGTFNCNIPRGYNFILGYSDVGLNGSVTGFEPALYNNVQNQQNEI